MPFCAPQIVYSNSWLGQTADITNGVIFTTGGSDGLYRISSATFITNQTGTSTSVNTTLDWEIGTNGVNINFVYTAFGFPPPDYSSMAGSQTVSIPAGKRVFLKTVVSGLPDLDHYDVYVTIEQLQ